MVVGGQGQLGDGLYRRAVEGAMAAGMGRRGDGAGVARMQATGGVECVEAEVLGLLVDAADAVRAPGVAGGAPGGGL